MKHQGNNIFWRSLRHKSKIQLVLLGGVFIIILIGIGIAIRVLFPTPSSDLRATTLQEFAEQVMETCSATNYHPACYDEEIPKLMDYISMEEAFEVAKIVQATDPSYGYCHVLGHYLAGRETAKDPSKWAENLYRCPRGVCSNGCLHGGAQERFRGSILTDEQIEELKPLIMGACDPSPAWDPIGLEQAECYHGLGHLTLYVNGADFSKSMDMCDEISITDAGNFLNLCYEGLFMQLFQPLEGEDFALVDGLAPEKKEDLRSFCEQFGSEERIEACWSEGWPLYRDEITTPEGTVQYCSLSASPSSRAQCEAMLIYIRAQSWNYDSEKLAKFCGGMPLSIKGNCFGQIANAMIHGGLRLIGRAVEFCSFAKEYGVEQECYQTIARFAYFNVGFGSEEFSKLCNSIPQSFREQCLSGPKS